MRADPVVIDQIFELIIHNKENYIPNRHISTRGMLMSLDLKEVLRRVAEEDCESEKEEIEGRLDRYKSLILEIARVKGFDLAIEIEDLVWRYRSEHAGCLFSSDALTSPAIL